MENTKDIEEQLEYISSSIDSIESSIDDFSENYNNGSHLGGLEIIILIVLLCINSNIKKLTRAISSKNMINK